MNSVSVLVGAELAHSPGMSANQDTGHAAAQPQHHGRLIVAMRWVVAIGALAVYLGGVRLLLDEGARWVITCGQIVRRMLGCP